MFCASCNLHFPDHLSFCRRCGQPLVRSAGEQANDSVCCTRCGARGTRTENFCQQCGHSLAARAQETVVGACYHCGTSWRSGWLFCKTCGLDRDRALLRSTSTPAQTAPPKKAAGEELPEIEKIFCKRCGTSAKPYSRFCETCGNTLDLPKDAPNTGKLKTPPAAASLRTQIDAPLMGAQSQEEPVQIGRTTQSDPPTPRIVRRLTPEAGRRKTVAFAERTYTGNITNRTTDRVETPPPRTQDEFRPVAAPSSSSPSGRLRFRSRKAAPAADKDLGPERRIVWPLIAAGMLVLLAVLTIVWWMRVQRQRALPEADQITINNTEDASLPPAEPRPTTSAPVAQTVGIMPPPGMVYIPGGTFDMGRNGADESEGPAHKITVKPFFIDQTEVTNQEYLRFVSAAQYPPPRDWAGGKYPAGADRMPVVNVSWEDAVAYAKWAGKRLPSEAEWEFAARGTDGRIYPWGNDWALAKANVGNQQQGRIVNVGGYLSGASPYGALDMCGNVWEWTSSKLLRYSDRSEIAPGRVVRGGAYNGDEKTSTTTYRGVLQPEKPYPRTGIRCVRDVS
jgi:formylglycine-generating enzyme required for sulfatase activity